MKNNEMKKAIYTSLLYVFIAISIELFQFAYFGWGLFPSYFFYNFSFLFLFAFIILATKRQKIRNIIVSILFALQVIVTYTNICVMKTLNTVFTFSMLGLAGETVAVLEFNLFPWWPFLFLVLETVYFIIMLRMISRMKLEKYKKEDTSIKQFRIRSLVVGLSLALCFYSVDNIRLNKSSEIASAVTEEEFSELFTDHYLHNTLYSATEAIKKFGTFQFYFIQLVDMIFNIEYTYADEKDVIDFMSTEEYDPTADKLFGICKDENLITIMAESFEWYAIDERITPVLFALANGYDFTEIKNNLSTTNIVFNSEEEIDNNNAYFYNFVSRGDGTYKTIRNTNFQYNETLENNYGLSLVNYYSKAKTDYSEASVVLGNYPFGKSFTNRVSFTSTGSYSDIDYSFTLPNKLKSVGYDANYFHSWKSTFYGRDTLLPMYGFDTTTFVDTTEGIENYKGNYLRYGSRDSAFVQLNRDKILNSESDNKFFSFFTTVTTHGSYADENHLIPENYEFVDGIDYLKTDIKSVDSCVRTYLASAIELDYAMAYLVYSLIQEGTFDNTTILIFSDHNGYYNSLDSLYKSLFYSDENIADYHWAKVASKDELNYEKYTSEKYCVPAFIYSTKLTDEVCGDNHYVTKFTQAFDLTVTLMTLLGVDYDTYCYLGYPVFNNELGNEVIISMTDGVFSREIFTFDANDVLWSLNDGLTKSKFSYFRNKAVRFLDKWLKVTAIYDYNMF